jgi:hypothetical protein
VVVHENGLDGRRVSDEPQRRPETESGADHHLVTAPKLVEEPEGVSAERDRVSDGNRTRD